MLEQQTALDFQLTRVPADFIDNPYPYYALLRGHDPLHRLDDGGVLLTRYDDVAAVYRDAHASSDKKIEFKPKFGDSPLYEHHTTSLVFSDPPLHTRVRRLLMGALNQRAITRMEPDVARLVDQLLDRVAQNSEVDLIEDFAARIPVEVIGNLLGVPYAEREPLRGWSLDVLSALEPAPSAAILARGNAAVRDFLDYLKTLVERRRQQPGDAESDVLTRLIQGESDGTRLTERELLHNSIFMLNAGHETTTNLIGNGMYALLTDQTQLQRLIRQPELIGSAVEEMLRYESPLQLNNRLTTAPLALASTTLPAHTFVTLCIGAANRDPAQFAEPERLDIARKPNRHLAFGHGDHACAGMNVARLEARVAIGRFLARFPRVQLSAPPQRDRRVRFRGLRHLPVRLR